jgi:ABC-type phosphate transport system permease subunit
MPKHKYDEVALDLVVSVFLCLSVATLTFFQFRKGVVSISDSTLIVVEILAICLFVLSCTLIARVVVVAKRAQRRCNDGFAACGEERMSEGLWGRLCMVITVTLLGIPLGIEIAVRIGTDLEGFLFLEKMRERVVGVLIIFSLAYMSWRFFRGRARRHA